MVLTQRHYFNTYYHNFNVQKNIINWQNKQEEEYNSESPINMKTLNDDDDDENKENIEIKKEEEQKEEKKEKKKVKRKIKNEEVKKQKREAKNKDYSNN